MTNEVQKMPKILPSSVNNALAQTSVGPLLHTIPMGKIGEFELSRLVMGGNLIGGWSHARDLIYVDKLVKMYHTDEKVMMTLQLAEKCGINAIISNPQQCRIVSKYRQETGGKRRHVGNRHEFFKSVKR